MSFCCAAENQFGPKVAEHDLQRYRRRGPDIVTKFMLTQLRRWPLQNKQLLNIGGGIGVISAELAADGIAGHGQFEISHRIRPKRFVELSSSAPPGST